MTILIKKLSTYGLRAGLVVLFIFAMTACQTTGNAGRTTGTLVGGAVGGIVGSQVGKGSGNAVATVVGATLGAIIGGELGDEDRYARKPGHHNPHYNQSYEQALYRAVHAPMGRKFHFGDRYGARHGYVTATTVRYYIKGRPCRVVKTVETYRDGRQNKYHTRVCRMHNGDWKIDQVWHY
jgi:surface antigen